MPILEVEVVESGGAAPPDLARRIADAAAEALGSAPQSVWVRLRTLPRAQYAENGGTPSDAAPVFVSMLTREPPEGAGLEEEVARLTRAIAGACGRREENVHVVYQPAARGRIAFGGRLVT